jgi:hypothetical protein
MQYTTAKERKQVCKSHRQHTGCRIKARAKTGAIPVLDRHSFDL